MVRRIRADFTGQLTAHRRDEHNHVVLAAPLTLSAGDEVPDGVQVSDRFLDQEGSAQTRPAPPSDDVVLHDRPAFDPSEFSVDEVNERLDGLTDDQVRRVLVAETMGRRRTGITNGPAARRLH
jgi:hypothetical protein